MLRAQWRQGGGFCIVITMLLLLVYSYSYCYSYSCCYWIVITMLLLWDCDCSLMLWLKYTPRPSLFPRKGNNILQRLCEQFTQFSVRHLAFASPFAFGWIANWEKMLSCPPPLFCFAFSLLPFVWKANWFPCRSLIGTQHHYGSVARLNGWIGWTVNTYSVLFEKRIDSHPPWLAHNTTIEWGVYL